MTARDDFRVENLDDFIGQTELKTRLKTHIDAAKIEYRPLDHVLLCGPPGFGKTSLATVIANEFNAKLEVAEMPIPHRRLVDLVQHFHGVLLLDEIHSAPPKLQEKLFPLLEFGWIQHGQGIKIYSDRLTVIGATTEREKLLKPLLDRFPIIPDFDSYSDEEMGSIVTSMAYKGGVTLPPNTAIPLGRATGGTPRKARQFVLAARDLAATGVEPTAEAVLHLCRVDVDGVTYQHSEYLKALYGLSGIAGMSTLRNVLRLSEPVVRELETLLLQKQYITFTERGRELTSRGQEKIRGE